MDICVNIEEFLRSRGIKIVENFEEYPRINDFRGNEEKLEKSIKNQLYAISEFHKSTIGFKGHICERVNNSTGKLVEEYKVELKRYKRYLKLLMEKQNPNYFEKIVLNSGQEYLEKGCKALTLVDDSGYINIIKRSMDRGEFCIGNPMFSNLRKRGDVEVIKINKFCYDFIEMDGVHFLAKLKKRQLRLDFKELISYFCSCEGLGKESEELMYFILCYPYEFIKWVNRYKINEKNLEEIVYIKKIKNAVNIEGSFNIN